MRYTVSDCCVALILGREETLSAQTAKNIINELLKKNTGLVWDEMYIDIFSGKSGSLLLARPKVITKMSIAPYALPFLKDYFTE